VGGALTIAATDYDQFRDLSNEPMIGGKKPKTNRCLAAAMHGQICS
jgi:hypothetical protein